MKCVLGGNLLNKERKARWFLLSSQGPPKKGLLVLKYYLETYRKLPKKEEAVQPEKKVKLQTPASALCLPKLWPW